MMGSGIEVELRRRGRRETVVVTAETDRCVGDEKMVGGDWAVVAGDLRRTGIELGDVLCETERDMYLE